MSGYVSPESRAELGPPCIAPGCAVREDGSNSTCVIWNGKRLCYRHFAAFSEHPLADVCSQRGSGPTAPEWEQFLSTLSPTQKTGVAA